MRLTDALRLQPGMSVAFTGAGGKSSCLAALAREARGRFPILLSTTTRLATAQRALADDHLVLTTVEEAGRVAFRADRPLLLTGPELSDEGKLPGPGVDVLEVVARRAKQEGALVAIEADGARGRWVKAPADHEPVVPSWVDVVVPVAGLQAVGAPLSEQTVHRAERAAHQLEMAQGDDFTATHLARLLASDQGGLKGIPDGAEVRVLLTGLNTSKAEAAREVADRLLAGPRVRAVLAGDLGSPDPVTDVTGRVAGVVLAAGAGRRFGGPKQLFRWKGQPLVAHVLDAAAKGGLSPLIVVLGADSGSVREAAAGAGAIFVENPEWDDGQSTSVRVGLSAVEAHVEAAVFLLADMPQVSAATIDRLVRAHRSGLPAIVAPVGGGRRGNPVLFDRRVFADLHALEGDAGGRSLLDRWPWQAIEVDPREFLEVDRPEDAEALERPA